MTIMDLSRQPAPPDVRADVIVIGSGCGGATAARVLAEAGKDVVVLEEGGDYTGASLTGRDGEMYDQLYMDRGGRSTEDLAISVLQGRVLGGGGVINACDVVPIPEGVLDHWRRRFGLADLTAAAVAPYQAAALRDLSATPVPEDLVNKANDLVRAGTRKLGWRGHLMHHNREGCEELGTCLIGCPADAKRNPRFVSLPAAMAAGARVFTRARAVRIEGSRAELKHVVVRTLDPRGYHERGELVMRAPHVIVAANAINTAQLLLRSGIGNAHVGRHLMLQPQLPVVARFDQPVRAFRGIPQAYAVTQFEQEDHPEHGLYGFRIEPIMGTPGIVASLVPHTGREGKELMTWYDRIAACLVLVPDLPSGRVSLLGSGRPLIRYDHREDHKARLRAGMKAAVRVYLAAGAREVIVPLNRPLVFRSERDLAQADAVGLEPATAPLISAHQQGTVRLSPSRRDGGADPSGRVYGTRGVYVFDSSGFPSSASSHTMTPIITISRMLSARLAASL